MRLRNQLHATFSNIKYRSVFYAALVLVIVMLYALTGFAEASVEPQKIITLLKPAHKQSNIMPASSPVAEILPSPSHQKDVAIPQQLIPNDTIPGDDVASDNEDQHIFYLVTRVIDGDTVVVFRQEKSTTVRLIGVDSPESVSTKTAPECYGKQAAETAKSLLLGKQVMLESDDSQDEYDIYGRLLRYVYLSNGELVNKYLIAQGFAREYTFKKAYEYQSEFRKAQQQAKIEQKGLWNPENCKE
jgi:micrococcal nuclease